MYVYAQDTNWNEVEFEDTFGTNFYTEKFDFYEI